MKVWHARRDDRGASSLKKGRELALEAAEVSRFNCLFDFLGVNCGKAVTQFDHIHRKGQYMLTVKMLIIFPSRPYKMRIEVSGQKTDVNNLQLCHYCVILVSPHAVQHCKNTHLNSATTAALLKHHLQVVSSFLVQLPPVFLM